MEAVNNLYLFAVWGAIANLIVTIALVAVSMSTSRALDYHKAILAELRKANETQLG